jgi:hypothetical protein
MMTIDGSGRHRYLKVMKRRSFYSQHELAIWMLFVIVSMAGLYIALCNNADGLWGLSTPLVRFIP